ncbi:ornithine--oxo-acid transaminase [candidate division KSB1 bacterium]|nr:ornithine--oxo-acid transaminase [candidate division KSB1 bacterium]
MEVPKTTQDYITLEDQYGAHNYHPLDIVISAAEGVWVYDVAGNRYMDCLSAYSAVNQGHCHPKILAAFEKQARKVTLTSRAFRNDQLPLFCEKLALLSGMDMVLPMNSGAEAVETAVKAARKWGYKHKGIPEGQAEIIVCENNFHGRTTTIVGFSTEEQYKDGFGPFTPGFKVIPFGDAAALEQAITPNTCAFMVEPIQGEAGILIPPDGYLSKVRELCTQHNALLILDEIQCGLGRVGKLFAFQYENVTPDAIIIGKALSGGFMPVSAVLANKEVLGVFNPGDHGSTFGGNPLGCAVALAALDVIVDEKLAERSYELGQKFVEMLKTIDCPRIVDIRGKGLFIGIELDTEARPYCEALKNEGLLCKETHENVIRFAPPLVISEEEIEWAFDRIKIVLENETVLAAA